MTSAYDYLDKIDAETIEEMAEQTGLDFNAVKVPAFFEGEDEDNLETIPDMVAILREDTREYLGMVGKNRGILQYSEMLDFTEVLVEQEDASYIAGGPIDNGRQAYIIMESGDHLDFGEDKLSCNFFVSASHDSSRALEIAVCPQRKSNGDLLGLPLANRLKWRHTKNVKDRVLRAKKSISAVRSFWNDFADSFESFRECKIGEKQIETYLNMVVPEPENATERGEIRAANIRDEILSIYNNSRTCNFPSMKGTLLGLYCAVIEYQEGKKVKQTERLKTERDKKDAQLVHCLDGTGARKKAEAYGFALNMRDKLQGLNRP